MKNFLKITHCYGILFNNVCNVTQSGNLRLCISNSCKVSYMTETFSSVCSSLSHFLRGCLFNCKSNVDTDPRSEAEIYQRIKKSVNKYLYKLQT